MRNISWKWIGLAVAMAACAGPTASAGPVRYEWTPMAGIGYYLKPPTDQMVPFQSWDGTLSITYDPDNSANDLISASIGDPVGMGFGAGGFGGSFNVSLRGDYLFLSGTSGYGLSTAYVSLTGDPGPLTADGLPETLDGFLGQEVQVGGGTGSNEGGGVFFRGVAGPGAPEPPGLLMLALGIGGIALTRAKRRTGASSN
jgi:hypothetical protein